MAGLEPVFSVRLEQAGTTWQMRLMGEFDLAGVGRVEDAFDRVFTASATRRVVVDLRQLSFLDVAGLRTILRADQRAHLAALELIVVRPSGTANRVFTLTRAGQELTMVDEPEFAA